MPIVKRMVCLANSRKLSGRCVAGKEIVENRAGGWIRPVSDREHEEVSEYERQYQDGGDPRLLDIIDVPLLEARPTNFQQENWLLSDKHYWTKVGQFNWDELPGLTDPVSPLWTNGHSTGNGLNDKIPILFANGLQSSLRFVRPDWLWISVINPGEAFGNDKRRVQGRFQHDGVEYRMWVTDPVYERAYLARPDGDYVLNESYLTISLGEAYKGSYYKLIAAILQPE